MKNAIREVPLQSYVTACLVAGYAFGLFCGWLVFS